jgi:hypothetical protein
MPQQTTTSTATSTPADQRHGINVAIGASYGALEHGQALNLWATPDMDDYAYEAVYDASRISLADAEKDIRTQLAEHNVHVTAFLNEDGPLVARQRGAAWMLRWGCTPDCVTDHTDPATTDWHVTSRIETQLRDIDSSYSPSENAELPWLAAQVVIVSDKPQAYGRTTRVWLDYGRTTGELSPVEARQALKAVRGFVTTFEAVVEAAERTAADDFDGDPEIARLDQEHEDRRIRAITEAHR